MGKIYDRVYMIWSDLETSYEKFSLPNETKKSFLMRLAGDEGKGSNISSILVSLEKEFKDEPDLIEDGRVLSDLLISLHNKWDKIKEVENVKNLNIFVADIVREYLKSNISEGFDMFQLSYNLSSPIILEPIEMYANHNCLSSFTVESSDGVTSVEITPMKEQVTIAVNGIAGLLSLYELVEDRRTTFLKVAYKIAYEEIQKDASKSLLFIPKNCYRKTSVGCKVHYKGLGLSIKESGKIGEYSYAQQDKSLIVWLPYEHEPLY